MLVFLGLVKVNFPLENPFINLIYLNHHLIHLQKCRFSTLNIEYYVEKDLHQRFIFLMVSQFFVDASLNSKSPYFLLKKNINSKTRRNHKWKILHKLM